MARNTGGACMTPAKRLFDVLFSLLLMVLLAVPFAVLLLVLLVTEGRPLFHVAPRMKAPGQPGDAGVSGGDKQSRITRIGARLRRTRLDEVPQLWNILRGDMSFVGPRPPLPVYVQRFPDLYAQVLKSRPGVTGLATLRFHRREEVLLSRCTTAAETDAVYCRRCIPAKARLDLIYQKRRTLCFDFILLWDTLKRVLFRHSA
jgi:lipopolysaccharide/colanic/teichoic acid biosynthesis glycosyltransferase